MEFFLLFILNIFTGAVIYLILSLKIERTSSTFQEQKLKKEMGEIITEFNATAERNITLLENRINLLKRLLNEKGDFRGIDFVLDDDKIKQGKTPDVGNKSIDNVSASVSVGTVTGRKKSESQNQGGKNDGSLLVGVIDKISNISRDGKSSVQSDRKNAADVEEGKKISKKETARFDFIVDSEIDFSGTAADDKPDYPDMKVMQKEKEDEDIASLFSNASDKYSLINDLHGKGYSVDDISRYSGLPSGEVRLVISLNR